MCVVCVSVPVSCWCCYCQYHGVYYYCSSQLTIYEKTADAAALLAVDFLVLLAIIYFASDYINNDILNSCWFCFVYFWSGVSSRAWWCLFAQYSVQFTRLRCNFIYFITYVRITMLRQNLFEFSFISNIREKYTEEWLDLLYNIYL